MPFCKRHLDVYGKTKELGERIAIGANGTGGLATVALRPAGMSSPPSRYFYEPSTLSFLSFFFQNRKIWSWGQGIMAWIR